MSTGLLRRGEVLEIVASPGGDVKSLYSTDHYIGLAVLLPLAHMATDVKFDRLES